MSEIRRDHQARTLVIVPAFNEARAIGPAVRGLVAGGWRVLVVDDGSTDSTATLAAEAGAVVLRHAVNLGQGAALRTGFDWALRNPATLWVVTFDADGQHPAEAIEALVAPLSRHEVDVVLGSRFLDPAARLAVPGARRVLLRMATWMARATTGLPVTDTHNGLRAITKSALQRMRLTQDRMAHASEILAQVAAQGLRMQEVPVHVRYSAYSVGKGQRTVDALNILWDLLVSRTR